MFVTPGSAPKRGYNLTRDAAAQVARNWWVLLFNGALLVVAGFLIFSIPAVEPNTQMGRGGFEPPSDGL